MSGWHARSRSRSSADPEQKADTILGPSREIVEKHGGETPADFAALTAFEGIGPKCANLARGVALGIPAICIDVHVRRVVPTTSAPYAPRTRSTGAPIRHVPR